jgi:hypothetical protein
MLSLLNPGAGKGVDLKVETSAVDVRYVPVICIRYNQAHTSQLSSYKVIFYLLPEAEGVNGVFIIS